MKTLLISGDTKLQKIAENHFAEVHHVKDKEAGIRAIEKCKFDMVLLDLAVSRQSCLDLMNIIRGHDQFLPIMALTEDDSVQEIINILNSGADNCLSRPFEPKVLVAKIKAMLRRAQTVRGAELVYGPIRIDPVKHKAWRDNKEIELTQIEYKLLLFFVENSENIVSRAHISSSVWEHELDSFTNIIDVYVNYLRKKIDKGADKKLIHTLRGVGYIFSLSEPQ
ncbi:response regulator transcription factor [Geomonas nitrogeniifigens]|uniref:response regulator transcription factor n=1 Tax=Geomonas diazotrophica TaxID=2843197 RepID=UPI001C2C7714|nr:response regulator transcription factor [Geomonas nitrogeniifigens]QXE87351.1 response regulator transcription factor [Geomonas nitrogeniifigens]